MGALSDSGGVLSEAVRVWQGFSGPVAISAAVELLDGVLEWVLNFKEHWELLGLVNLGENSGALNWISKKTRFGPPVFPFFAFISVFSSFSLQHVFLACLWASSPTLSLSPSPFPSPRTLYWSLSSASIGLALIRHILLYKEQIWMLRCRMRCMCVLLSVYGLFFLIITVHSKLFPRFSIIFQINDEKLLLNQVIKSSVFPNVIKKLMKLRVNSLPGETHHTTPVRLPAQDS